MLHTLKIINSKRHVCVEPKYLFANISGLLTSLRLSQNLLLPEIYPNFLFHFPVIALDNRLRNNDNRFLL